jgi:hypothetical protein
MKNWYRKIWVFLFLFVVLSFFKNTLLGNLNLKEEILGINRYSVEENVLGEELVPIKSNVPKEEEEEKEGVYVPYYWKSGNGSGEGEYLKGYIPGMKGFKEYDTTRSSILMGSGRDSVNYTMRKLLDLARENTLFYSNGIYNESSFFEWSEDSCTKGYSELTTDFIFICDNWVNWLGVPVDEKVFVLVRCNIQGEEGYCMYEDYTKSYYDSKKQGETRCFGENFEEYLCTYAEYIELIRFDN